VGLKGKVGSGVGEWEKQCEGCWFFGPCVFGCISVVVVEGACGSDCSSLGLCKVGIVGWSAGNECVGGSGSLVTGWGRIRRSGEGWGKRVGEKRQNDLLGREQWILAQEKEGE
jgi:hypothetical protein